MDGTIELSEMGAATSSWESEDDHWKCLEPHRPQLIDNLRWTPVLQAHLVSKGLLSQEDIDEIGSAKGNTAAVTCLLRILKTREMSLAILSTALEQTRQTKALGLITSPCTCKLEKTAANEHEENLQDGPMSSRSPGFGPPEHVDLSLEEQPLMQQTVPVQDGSDPKAFKFSWAWKTCISMLLAIVLILSGFICIASTHWYFVSSDVTESTASLSHLSDEVSQPLDLDIFTVPQSSTNVLRFTKYSQTEAIFENCKRYPNLTVIVSPDNPDDWPKSHKPFCENRITEIVFVGRLHCDTIMTLMSFKELQKIGVRNATVIYPCSVVKREQLSRRTKLTRIQQIQIIGRESGSTISHLMDFFDFPNLKNLSIEHLKLNKNNTERFETFLQNAKTLEYLQVHIDLASSSNFGSKPLVLNVLFLNISMTAKDSKHVINLQHSNLSFPLIRWLISDSWILPLNSLSHSLNLEAMDITLLDVESHKIIHIDSFLNTFPLLKSLRLKLVFRNNKMCPEEGIFGLSDVFCRTNLNSIQIFSENCPLKTTKKPSFVLISSRQASNCP